MVDMRSTMFKDPRSHHHDKHTGLTTKSGERSAKASLDGLVASFLAISRDGKPPKRR